MNCSSWDDSVDFANLKDWSYGEIPEDKFVMTTWHEKEPLPEVIWFVKYSAYHPAVELLDNIILHISADQSQSEFIDLWSNA